MQKLRVQRVKFGGIVCGLKVHNSALRWKNNARLKYQKEKNDRLSFSETGNSESKLLGVVTLPSEREESIRQSVSNAQNLESNIQFMCADTTSSNSESRIGACVSLCRKLKKDLLFLECHHHMLDFVDGSPFMALNIEEQITSPPIKIFITLRERWQSTDNDNFSDTVEKIYFYKRAA